MSPALIAALVLGAYLLGAVPFAFLAGKLLRGIDLREHGSGNLGATNALRVLGKRAGSGVLLLDAAKGGLPVALVPRLLEGAPAWLPVALAGAAILGHVFPAYLRFKGGKGVATSAGAFLALHPAAFGCAAAGFFACLALSRIVSLSSLVAAAVLPTAAVLLDGWSAASGPQAVRTGLFLAIATLVWVKHRANVGRLLRGEEPRIGQRAVASSGENSSAGNPSAEESSAESPSAGKSSSEGALGSEGPASA